MVTTNDPRIAEQVRLLRSHGQVERYRHITLGYNLRMTEIQGAIGLVQLEKLEHFTRQRIANAAFLTKYLNERIQTPVTLPGYRHVFHQYTIRVPGKRDEWVSQLRAKGIGTAVHYPLAIHQQPFYREHSDRYCLIHAREATNGRCAGGDDCLPAAEYAAEHVLSLPVHPALNEEKLSTIAREVWRLCA